MRYIHIGTSGWAYAHWKGPFYPKDHPSSEFLQYYAQEFQTVEINNSFYRLPSSQVFKRWKEITSKGFIFAIKVSRFITHIKRLNAPRQALRTFFSRVDYLGEKL